MEQEKFDESKINENSIAEYKNAYSEEGLLRKLTAYGKIIGLKTVYNAALLWYVMKKPELPLKEKTVIMGALGYLIAPLDFLPDLTPFLGYTDDVIAIAFALGKLSMYIDDDVKQQSKDLLVDIFGKDAVDKI